MRLPQHPGAHGQSSCPVQFSTCVQGAVSSSKCQAEASRRAVTLSNCNGHFYLCLCSTCRSDCNVGHPRADVLRARQGLCSSFPPWPPALLSAHSLTHWGCFQPLFAVCPPGPHSPGAYGCVPSSPTARVGQKVYANGGVNHCAPAALWTGNWGIKMASSRTQGLASSGGGPESPLRRESIISHRNTIPTDLALLDPSRPAPTPTPASWVSIPLTCQASDATATGIQGMGAGDSSQVFGSLRHCLGLGGCW